MPARTRRFLPILAPAIARVPATVTATVPARVPGIVPGIVLALALALAGLVTSSCKKDEPTYGDRMVGAIRESRAMDARGDMQAIAIAITQWIANDGDLVTAPDFPALVTALEPTWLRVVPKTDPWGAAYGFSTDGTSWELRTSGKDGIDRNEDDLVMRDGQITQMPKSYTQMGNN